MQWLLKNHLEVGLASVAKRASLICRELLVITKLKDSSLGEILKTVFIRLELASQRCYQV